MQCGDYDSSALISNLHNAPYSSSLATSASASSSSVWSDASSQSSDDASVSTAPSDTDSCASYCLPQGSQGLKRPFGSDAQRPLYGEVVPAELRQNPRRTGGSSTTRSGCPPPLVRQADRKVDFVDNLVDSSTQIVEAIWPLSSVVCRTETRSDRVLPLRTFIQETLRRSRTSYSTLQVALYYLILIKPHVPSHDFTMEQPVDCHVNRALQCGRRMFLAALILASKYLQDRNFSARAWSKISGLAAQEINQNEIAFLIAVNWDLHIREETYSRWTDCVMRFTPPQPPSPGAASQHLYEQQCEAFKMIVVQLTPALDNIDDLAPCTPVTSASLEMSPSSPQSIFSVKTSPFAYRSNDSTPRAYGAPAVLEPNPATVYTPGRLAPALGLLPTPRLTATSGYSTPAVSAASQLLNSNAPAMGMAMAHASNAYASHSMCRLPTSTTSSPLSYFSTRRSSLANSVSTASSPESMVSDSSRLSRSSSISSASSVGYAPSSKLDVQARCRYAKLCSERSSLKTMIATVPEDYEENRFTSSPDSYTGPLGKFAGEMALDTPLARTQSEMDDNDAARALQELQNYHGDAVAQFSAPRRPQLKRSRPISSEPSLQDNVREMLRGQLQRSETWSESLVRPALGNLQIPTPIDGGRKRMCCSAEALDAYPSMSTLHPANGGIGGPGMWTGILN